MIIVDKRLLKTYMEHDSLLGALNESVQDNDAEFTLHKQLIESQAKRMLYFYMYGGVSIVHRKSSMLDVGGGYCSYTRKLVQDYDYLLLDPLPALSEDANFRLNKDWGDWTPDKEFDLIIANELFPTVDQRLDTFIRRYLPHCRELRLSLNFYNTPKWYKVNEVNGNGVYTMMAWNGGQVRETLQKYQQSFVFVPHWDVFDSTESIFPDGRQVVIVKLIGELA